MLLSLLAAVVLAIVGLGVAIGAESSLLKNPDHLDKVTSSLLPSGASMDMGTWNRLVAMGRGDALSFGQGDQRYMVVRSESTWYVFPSTDEAEEGPAS